MNTSRHIAGAFAQVFSLDLISKILLGLGGIALIRYMAEREYAEYAVAMAVVMTIGQVLTAGIRWTYIIGHDRFAPAESPTSFLSLQLLVLAAISLAGMPFAPRLHGLYPVLVALTMATCLAEFSRTLLQQKRKFLSFSFVELWRAATFLLGLLALIGLTRYRIRAEWVLLIQAVASLAVFTVFVGRTTRLSDLLGLRSAIQYLRAIVTGPYQYLFLYSILLAVMSQADVFVLKLMLGSPAVAVYASAFRYYALVGLALNAAHTVLLPMVTQARDTEEIRRIFAQHRRAVGVFSVVVLGLVLAAGWFMPWIDLGKYPGAVGVFRILACSALISFAFSPHVNLIFRREEFRFLFVTSGVGLLVNVGLNVILVSRYGVIGAAWATMCSYGLVNITIFLRTRHGLRLSHPDTSPAAQEASV